MTELDLLFLRPDPRGHPEHAQGRADIPGEPGHHGPLLAHPAPVPHLSHHLPPRPRVHVSQVTAVFGVSVPDSEPAPGAGSRCVGPRVPGQSYTRGRSAG